MAAIRPYLGVKPAWAVYSPACAERHGVFNCTRDDGSEVEATGVFPSQALAADYCTEWPDAEPRGWVIKWQRDKDYIP